MSDPLKPSASLLCKLGSIVVHAEEGVLDESGRHHLDLIALRQVIEDDEVAAWRKAMDGLALLPVKRGRNP